MGILRSRIEFKEVNEQEWEEERKCQQLKQAWLRDFPEVFKEDLGKEDRIDMEPVVVDLIPDHKKIKVFHPKTSTEVPAYLQKAAEKELKRMLEGGLLEETNGYTEHVSRGFFLWRRTQNLGSL